METSVGHNIMLKSFCKVMDELYQEHIIENAKNPQNMREIISPSLVGNSHNISCGDKGTLFISLDGDFVKDISFTGSGCALSLAGFSMLTDKLKGKVMGEVRSFLPNDIYEMFGVKITPARSLCAMQCYNALQNALDNK